MKKAVSVLRQGTITTPKGFLANGVYCGIKRSRRPDLAILYSTVPAAASGAFTTNRFCASPVTVTRQHLKRGLAQALIVNSGNANCANGREGDRDALEMTRLAGQWLCIKRTSVLVASTGIIGRKLPIDRIRGALPDLVLGMGSDKGKTFARTILTTDTTVKECCVRIKLGSASATIAGACKGAGMIHPQLAIGGHATMLCFLTTDASITKKMLDRALSEAIERSFNMISVDGDMSTNDTVLILANGLARNGTIARDGADFSAFKEGLNHVTGELARKIVLDGEGATKFVTIIVRGASSARDARTIARHVTTSMLLKACLYGEDPNWGRVIAACGSAGVAFDPRKVDVYFAGTKVFSNGARMKTLPWQSLRRIFEKDSVRITIDLHSGAHEATAWTCDLSREYVDINAAYST